MQIIKRLSDTDTLNLPLSVKCALNDALISPFDNKDVASDFWSETGCFLMLIEHTDTTESLEKYDKSHGHWLDFITTCPESVLSITDDNKNIYLLALAITSDSGSGAYLLIPASHSSRYKDSLKTHLNNQKPITINR